MSEWTISIETGPGLTSSPDDLDRFDDKLRERPAALGVSSSMNTDRSTLAATFAVDAADAQAAVDTAVPLFLAALSDSGFEAGTVARVSVEPADDREPALA
jgi:hypothetical protein